jgi:signal peptidase I
LNPLILLRPSGWAGKPLLRAFAERRPWAAGLIAFVLGPTVGMLYLGRGWWALAYVVLELALELGARAVIPIILPDGLADAVSFLAILSVRLICTVQAVLIARRFDGRSPWYSRWYWILALALGPVLLALFTRLYVVRLFSVPAGSMIPTVNVGDYVAVSFIDYYRRDPARGDIVVLYHDGVYYVKRIVGLPGDTIQMVGGRLVLNGRPVPTVPVGRYDYWDEAGNPRKTIKLTETVAGGHSYTVLDERNDGPFDNTDVAVVPADHYFVLGDNRDDSNDSRVDLGFIPRAELVGRVWKKYWDGPMRRLAWRDLR